MWPPLQVKLLEGELYDIDGLIGTSQNLKELVKTVKYKYIYLRIFKILIHILLYIYLRYLFTYLLLSLSHIGSTGLTVGGCCLLLVTCTLWAPLCPRCHVGECLFRMQQSASDAAEQKVKTDPGEQHIGIGPDQGWFTMNSRKFMGTEQAIFIYWVTTHESVYIYRT